MLRDALFGGPGAADLLLPRALLGDLLPGPATRWLQERGSRCLWTHRVEALRPAPQGAGWVVDGMAYDAVVLACSATEAARLARPIDAGWADAASRLDYQPIVTVYLSSPGSCLSHPMTALCSSGQHPAQFVFDLGAIDGGGPRAGLFAFVVSGAREWLARGLDAIAQAALQQAAEAFAPGTWRVAPTLVQTIAERRATFACRPGLARPASGIAPGLAAAGDFVEGPYPATLEGAVMSARPALRWLQLDANPQVS